ncbi:MAG: methyl-accepting chemotaxis protein [Leptospiraceae bacterium]
MASTGKNDNDSADSILARSYRFSNYVRLGLALVFAGAVLATGIGRFHLIIIQAEAVGTLVYLFLGLLGLYLMRGGRIPRRYARLAVFLDLTTLGGIFAVVCFHGTYQAYQMIGNMPVFAIFFISIGYSALLGSPRFTFALTLYAGLLYAMGLVMAANNGVAFGGKPDPLNHVLSLPNCILQTLFIVLTGTIIAGVLQMHRGLSRIADDHAGEKAALIQSLKERREKLANHALELEATTADFKRFVEDTTGRIEAQAAALEQANAVSEELTASATSTSETVQSQSQGIERMASESQRLRSIIDHVARSNESLNRSARDSMDSMQATGEAIEQTTGSLLDLEQAFASVQQITTIMIEIADKTNLLSLNASIEAARAGDAGRGFAVVATEVSKLADYTAENVRKISDIVEQSLHTIANARSHADNAVSQATTQRTRTRETEQQVRATSDLLKSQNEILENLIAELETQRDRAGVVISTAREQIEGQQELARTITSLDSEVSRINEASTRLKQGIDSIARQSHELRALSQT